MNEDERTDFGHLKLHQVRTFGPELFVVLLTRRMLQLAVEPERPAVVSALKAAPTALGIVHQLSPAMRADVVEAADGVVLELGP